jgi:hypothetical protein
MNRQGTILKKCQCASKTRCPHGWTLRYWDPTASTKSGSKGALRERTFRDAPGKPGSGKKLAEDFTLKLAVGKRECDITFADKSKGAVRFVDYAAEWIDSHKNPPDPRGAAVHAQGDRRVPRPAARKSSRTSTSSRPRPCEPGTSKGYWITSG